MNIRRRRPIEMRCAAILANLWNVNQDEKPIGCSTIGSSEACMLGGMAALWRWRARRKAAGKPIDQAQPRMRPRADLLAQILPLLGH